MEPREAQEIIRMVEDNWQFDLGPDGRELWRTALLDFDAALATRAVAQLAKGPLPGNRFRPHLSDLRQVVVRIARDNAEQESWRGLLAAPTTMPGWVVRWQHARAAGDERLFPEQLAGLLELQKIDPLNAWAYALPKEHESDAEVWVQPDEYLEAAAA